MAIIKSVLYEPSKFNSRLIFELFVFFVILIYLHVAVGVMVSVEPFLSIYPVIPWIDLSPPYGSSFPKKMYVVNMHYFMLLEFNS